MEQYLIYKNILGDDEFYKVIKMAEDLGSTLLRDNAFDEDYNLEDYIFTMLKSASINKIKKEAQLQAKQINIINDEIDKYVDNKLKSYNL